MTRPPCVSSLTLALGMLAAGVAGGESPGASASPACVDGHFESTVSLHYDDRTLGAVAGLFLQVAYPDGVSVPGKGSDESVRARITSLLDAKFRLVSVDEDTNADGREDRVRVLLVATTKDALPAAPVARIRFDCDKQPAATSFRCTTDQVADGAGQPMREQEARQVACQVTFPAGFPSAASR